MICCNSTNYFVIPFYCFKTSRLQTVRGGIELEIRYSTKYLYSS